jgi:hypothetical protein
MGKEFLLINKKITMEFDKEFTNLLKASGTGQGIEYLNRLKLKYKKISSMAKDVRMELAKRRMEDPNSDDNYMERVLKIEAGCDLRISKIHFVITRDKKLKEIHNELDEMSYRAHTVEQ